MNRKENSVKIAKHTEKIKVIMASFFAQNEFMVDGKSIYMTVTDVISSADGSHLKIMLESHAISTKDKEDIVLLLQSRSKKMAYITLSGLRLRKMPSLHFAIDGILDRNDRILNAMEKSRDSIEISTIEEDLSSMTEQ